MTHSHAASGRARWKAIPVVALLLAGLVVTGHLLGSVHWTDVWAHVQDTPARTLGLAVLFTTGSYLLLVLYDAAALAANGLALRWYQVLLTAFPAFAVGHNLGFAVLSGGSIRYRWYSRAGLAAAQIARVIAFTTFTFGLGAALLGGLSLALRPALAGQVLRLGTTGALLTGVALVLLVLGYCLSGLFRREPVVFGRFSVPVPRPRVALAQTIVACADLACAAGVLYVLLPAGVAPGFIAFLSIYVLAIFAGLLSSVPGGVGVFEGVLLFLLRDAASEQLLAALLMYRAIYYLAPFALALLILAMRELWNGRIALARAADWARAWLRLAVPQAVSLAVFFCGLLLLFSGATPAEQERMRILRHLLPLPLVEASHLVGSVAGISLVLLAQGLQRRLDAAWHVTLLLLALGAGASLAKGLDFEEAALLVGMAVLLYVVKDRFQRRASMLEQRFSRGWMVAVAAALLSSLVLAWVSYRDVQYTGEMWWQFAFHADAPRALRAAVLTVVTVGLVAAWLLLRPAPHKPGLPGPAELVRARAVLAASPDTSAWLAMLGDKNLMFSADGLGLLMYRPVGRNWIAMGDPVGPRATRHELIWQFREACDRYAARPVFYQVGVDDLPAYIEAGFVLSKIGEEARVPLREFSLEGGRRADLRQTHRRAQRDGASFEVIPVAQMPGHLDALRAVSDSWLNSLAVAEKGFSLGRFDPRYLANFSCAVVRSGGQIVAFANIWEAAGHAELSVDLMRHVPGAPKGVMDYLMIELMLWGRAQGFAWFNLGMAPLAGLVERQFAPLWNRVGAFLYHHGEHFYNFEGLRSYKQKFLPEWRPRYLATANHLMLPRAVMDVAGLIAGSSRRIVMR